jgi:hypothetical protein
MSIPTITVVHAPACHLCSDAQQALIVLEQEIPFQVDLIEAGSVAGTALVGTHRPTMFPLVLIDGVFFSQGRLPRRKLRTLLESRKAVTTP